MDWTWAKTDALGALVTEELRDDFVAALEIRSTVANYMARLVVAGSSAVLALVMPARGLVPAVLAWGMALLRALTYLVARARGVAPGAEVLKHLAVAIVVILVSRGISAWILARGSP